MKSIRFRFVFPALLFGALLASAAATAQSLPKDIKKIKIDEEQMRAHAIRPANLEGVTHSKGLEEGDLHYRMPTPSSARPHLDVGGFGRSLQAALKGSVVGYAMQLRKNGYPICTLEWQWSEAPGDGTQEWNLERQMHIASCSKLVTAMGMTKLLDEKGIPYDAAIASHLPAYWKRGSNIDKITFRNLMTHTSGFTTSATDYSSMKEQVEQGVLDSPGSKVGLGKYKYANMNFGLCRILIATIDGYIPTSLDLPDTLWDYITIRAYDHYMQNRVFKPAGVQMATMSHPSGGVFAYQFPNDSAGWNSGDLSSVVGGAGWHLSVDELLRVMDAFRRRGTIMPTRRALEMMDAGFGLDLVGLDTPAGKLYNKNGLWADGGGHTEQSLAYFLPEDMELVVLANSPVGNPGKFLRDVVTLCYLDNIK